VPALSNIDCEVGDSVVLQAPVKKTYLSTLIMYVIPIVIMIVSAIISYSVSKNDLVVLISCAVSLVVSFALVFLLDKLVRSKKNMPLIVKNLSKNNTTEG
jgi:positive regulator of sigma E activity